MVSTLELYIIPGELYPRRVTIYLAEKCLSPNDLQVQITAVSTTLTLQMAAPGKPPGTGQTLALGDGTFIHQSIAILEYLEDMCDRNIDSPEIAQPSMRGTTLRERATTREMMQLADEATSLFSLACHKGSGMFSM
ncbi:uncharacterized protein A1O9_02305, partial [Exophiala aquamarina CBS 119918]